MTVPIITFFRVRLAWLLSGILVAAPVMWGARGPQPAISIPLGPLGYQAASTEFMLAGSSMLTVHFVDEQHVLLTYNVKRLLKRLPDCPPEDQDRTIAAVLLELPSGKELARTEWRLHDRGQYLWNLGKGRFMLRVRNTLTTFAPLANLALGRPFAELPVVSTQRRIEAILLSPDADLMIVESREPKSTSDAAAQEADPVQVDFFRVVLPEGRGDEVVLRRAGQIFARGTGRVPADSTGYVAIIDQGRQRWAFDFRSYNGKVKELAPFGSSCRPSPFLVSRSEFIAFGCHESHTPQVVGGFNLRGEEMWEQNFTDNYVAPMFVFAPAGGRFAMSRMILNAPFETEMLTPDLVGGQRVVVYQTDSGKNILRVDCSPIERAGQNFALSPDGMELAVIRNEAIEVYNLPPLTAEEKKAIQLAKASEPEETNAVVKFAQAASAEAEESPHASTPAQTPPDGSNGQGQSGIQDSSKSTGSSSTNTSTSSATNGASSSTAPPDEPSRTGDPGTETRKPPTIYTLPGDRPGSGQSDEKQQPKQPQH
jgi:hypothetical protein